MFARIGNLVAKEFIQFFRDRLMAAFILSLPVLQLILLARATGSRISDLCVGVLDLDRSSASRQVIAELDNRRELEVCHYPQTLAEAHRLLDQGEVILVAMIPADFAASLAGPMQTPSLQLVVDGSNNIPAWIALSAAQEATSRFATKAVADALPSGAFLSPVIDLRMEVRFNPLFNLRYFSIPAQVGFIVYQVTLAVASIGLARERELGTLEQLIVMPIGRAELIIGKATLALVVGASNFLLMLGVAVFVFGVPMRGSLFLLFALTLLFVAAEIGYGLVISSIARTQQQAILLVFVLAMADISFSGYLVRVKNLPAALRVIAHLVPFSHYLTIIRGVMLKGAGWRILWPHAAAIAAMGALVAFVAMRGLSRRLD